MQQARQIRFEDGAAYEEFMGKWSRLAGDAFLRWLDPAPGWRWVDVGCGNGAFTEMLVERCAPAPWPASTRPPSRSRTLASGSRATRPASMSAMRWPCPMPTPSSMPPSWRSSSSSFPIPPGRSRRWCASSGPAAACRPTPGTSSAAAFPYQALQDEMAKLAVDAALAAERRSLEDGDDARALGRRRPDGDRDARAHRRADVRRLRLVLEDRADRSAPRREHRRDAAPAIGRP